ncbi:MAG: exonuclease subunit SbcD [Saprospiraceae bacterium]
MKIIHTADWHIGKILHKQELHEEISLFLDWLITYIHDHAIDVLLVSGDIFDLANPSHKDTKLYYDTLTKLINAGTKVIITGGNHDSIHLINAPSRLLKPLNIDVIGGVPDEAGQQIIPVYDVRGAISCIVLAVPFLRDKDLRKSQSADIATDKSLTTQSAIKSHYDELVMTAIKEYGTDLPIVAMGHLYMRGALTSDSEREIHVGTLQGIASEVIGDAISYMALGHIHKPQIIDKKNHIRYSGSPVYLDFSESAYEKMIIVLDVMPNKSIDVEPIKLPKFRELLRLKGPLTDIVSTLNTYKNPYPLITCIELEVIEPYFDLSLMHEFQLLADQSTTEYKVIKSKISFGDATTNLQDYVQLDKGIDEMSPLQILDNRLQNEQLDDDKITEIRQAYLDIVQELTN